MTSMQAWTTEFATQDGYVPGMFRLLVLSACCWVALTGSAVAQTGSAGDEEARHHFEAGQALVQVESFASARFEFRRGFELSQRPLFLFNMAECSRHLELFDDARREYSEYLRREPESAFSSIASERLAELGPGDTSTPSFINAGEVGHTTHVDDAELSTGIGGTQGTDRGEAHDTDMSGAQESTSKWYKHWAFWTVLGVVVVGGAIAIGVAASGDSVPACTPPMCIDWQ